MDQGQTTAAEPRSESIAAPTALDPALPLKARVQAGLRQWPADARAWLRYHGYELWLITGIWAVLSVLIFWLASGHESPRRYQDEFLFWAVAKSFANGMGVTWRGSSIGLMSWLYPVLLAPAFWLSSSVASSYTIVHMLNSLFMVGTIFPAFLIARMYLDRWPAVLAALMAVSVPALNYAGIIGTESLAYLTCTAAFGGMLLSIARPRLRNWMLALALMFLALLTRTQFAILLPVYLATIVLAGAMRAPGARREFFARQKWMIGSILALFALVGLVFLIKGRSTVGLYGGVFDGVPLTWDAVKFWVKAFSADIYLLAGVIPVIATFAMLFDRENRRDPLVGALLALALVATIAFIAQIGWFSATNAYDWRTRHIFYERYMFYLGPLFFTGFFVAWRRVSIGSAIISTLIAFFVMTGFQTDAVLYPFSYDSFGLTLTAWFMDAHTGWVPHIGSLMARVTFLLGVVYLLATVPRKEIARIGMLISTILVFAILAIGQAKTWSYARLFSHDAFATFPKPATFIDHNTKQDVGMIVTSTDAPEMYFQTEFWNDRIVRAFATDAAPFKSPIMYSPKCVFDWDKTGAILGTGCDKVPSAYFLRSDTISVHLKDEIKRVHPGPDWPNLTLIVAKPPPRLLSIVDGRNVTNGIVEGAMNVRTFLDRPGQLRVSFEPSKQPHLITVGDRRTERVPAKRRGLITASIPAYDNTTVVQVKTTAGLPDTAIVTGLEVREPGGKWISIL